MGAGIYARISLDRDETQMGVGRQLADCEKLATKRGWAVHDRYVDNSVSAYKNVKRPEWERMLEDIRTGVIDSVIVYHLDRLARQPRDLERFFDICDRAGLKAMATVSGDIDLSTHDGRFHARIMGAVARKSSDDQSRRLVRKHLELAQAGKPSGGGSRPFGFEPDQITHRPDEAAIICDLADRLLAGETLRSLANSLNDRGIPTVRGLKWSPMTVRRMLSAGRLAGLREQGRYPNLKLVGPAVWEPIITVQQLERIRALFADPARRATRAPQKYVLKGLLRCWRCENHLVARPREDGKRRYVCPNQRDAGMKGCGGAYVFGPPCEEFVIEAVFARLDNPALAEAINGQARANGDGFQDRADQLTAKLEELAEAYGAEQITMREWLAAREPLQAELDTVTRRIRRSASVNVISDHIGNSSELRKRWPDLAIERQHAILGAMLHHVVVNPGRRGYNKFQPERFELVWRH